MLQLHRIMLLNSHAFPFEEDTHAQFGDLRFHLEPFVPVVDFPELVHHFDEKVVVDFPELVRHFDEKVVVDFPELVRHFDEKVVEKDMDCTTQITFDIGMEHPNLESSFADDRVAIPVKSVTYPNRLVRVDGKNAYNSEETQLLDSAADWTAQTLRRNNLTTWRKRYADEQTTMLKAFFSKTDKPTLIQKSQIAFETDLTVEQVATWFNNRRKRLVEVQRRFK